MTLPGPSQSVTRPYPAESELHFQAIFDSSIDALLIADNFRCYVDGNRAACDLLGVTREDLVKHRVDDFAPPEIRAEMEQAWQSFMDAGYQRGEYQIVRMDGTLRYVEYSAKANILPGRHLSSLRDVTDRKKAEEDLRQLSGRLLTLQDDERRRIARELHDSSAQLLVALGMNLQTVRDEATSLPPRAARAVEESLELVQEMSKEIRTLSHLLHPPLLDEMGLASALKWYVDGFADRSKIPVKIELPANLERLSREMETAMFRIVQECLTNIHRHSDSHTAQIRIRRENHEVRVEVSDQGRGMAPGGQAGVGVRGMRERVRQLGGKLEIKSGHEGTAVIATLPIAGASKTVSATS